jgi:predicted peroxiredoxin
MTVLKRINPVLTIALLFSVLLGGFVLAQGGAPKQVVVHLTHYSDNLHAVKMAVHLASMMQGMGAKVTLFLDLEGVRLGSNKESAALISGKDDSIPKELSAFVKAGGQILLCPHCSEKAGITAGDLKPGARIGKDSDVARTVLTAHTILDY